MKINKVENSRILITGGAGFIGSNLVETLLQQNNEVVVLDNFMTGKRENIAPFVSNRLFSLIEGDIRDLSICRKAVDGVDYVLHEAALGSVPRSIKDPMTSTEVNISGFVNMLYAAQEVKVKRFVYASSSSVYGDSEILPKVEDKIGKPLSPYAITKYVNELYAENFGRIYGIETIGLRYFNAFGRRQDPNGPYAAVIPRFATSLIKHKSPVIYGDGTNSRDFTYIDDVVQANCKALLAVESGFVCNIAGGKQTALNELFTVLQQELSGFDRSIAQIRPQYAALRAGDIPHSLADISLARERLGYIPEYSALEGLRLTAEWYFESFK